LLGAFACSGESIDVGKPAARRQAACKAARGSAKSAALYRRKDEPEALRFARHRSAERGATSLNEGAVERIWAINGADGRFKRVSMYISR
jgi:hypothetical protein